METPSAPVTLADIPEEIKATLRDEVLALKRSGISKEKAGEYVNAWLDGFMRPSVAGNFVNGLAFGYADETKGAVGAAMGRGSGNRTIETARARGQIAGARMRSPKMAAGAELAGSVVPAALGGLGIAGAAGRMGVRPAANFIGKVVQGAGAGAAGGAVTGAAYGSGEAVGGAEERLAGAGEGAVEGATWGAGVGALAAPVAQAGQWAGRKISQALTTSGSRAGAERAVSGAMADAGVTADDVAARVAEARARGVPYTVTEGIGDPGRDIIDYAANTPGPGRTQLRQAIGQRQEGQPVRLNEATSRITGVNEGAATKQLNAQDAMRATAGPEYDAMNGVPLTARVRSGLARMLQHPEWADAYDDARAAARLDASTGALPREMPALESFLDGSADLTAREADLVLQAVQGRAKAGMQGGILPGTRANTGGPTGSRGLNRTADAIADMMRQDIPAFAAARKTVHDAKSYMEAIDLGEKSLGPSMSIDQLTQIWRRGDAETRAGIRDGFISKLKKELEDFRRGISADATRNVLDKEAYRQKIRVVLGDEMADDYLRQFELEDNVSKTAGRIMNSATSGREAMRGAIEGEPMGDIPLSPQGLFARALGKMDEATSRKMREEIANIGLLSDDAEIRRVLGRARTRDPALVSPIKSGAFVGTPVAIERQKFEDRR